MFLLKESENREKNNVPHVDKPGLEPEYARFRLYISIVVLTSPVVFPASRLVSRILKLSVYQFRHLSMFACYIFTDRAGRLTKLFHISH